MISCLKQARVLRDFPQPVHKVLSLLPQHPHPEDTTTTTATWWTRDPTGATKSEPGHRLQVDVKFFERTPGSRKKLYQFTAIGRLHPYSRSEDLRPMQPADDRLPFRILVVQMDNGAKFQLRATRRA
jgi:hypothetical protein